jgi:hypothetical protein
MRAASGAAQQFRARHPEAQACGHGGLPALEAHGAVPPAPRPARQVQDRARRADRRRLQRRRSPAHDQQPRAARRAQELPAGRDEQVDVGRRGVDRDLAERLGGVDEHERPGGVRAVRDGAKRRDDAGVRRHMTDADETRPAGEVALEVVEVESALWRVAGDAYLDAAAPLEQPERERLGGVLAGRGHDPVAGPPGDGRERELDGL